MLSQQDNELITAVAAGSPMGNLLRRYWMPAIRAARLAPGGAPVPVRLLGEDLVIFRTRDGQLGCLERACPHRAASLALARNEDGGLRCIFHGWKIDACGRVLDTPSEPAGSNLASKVSVVHYPVREAAGLIWAYLGSSDPPSFPAFGFMGVADDQVLARAALVHCNWLQALEANLDSSHLSILHGYWMSQVAGRLEGESKLADVTSVIALDSAPTYEIQPQPYGLAAAAVRNLPEGAKHIRVTQWLFPWYLMVPRPRGASEHVIAFVPVDAEHTLQWYVDFDRNRPLDDALRSSTGGLNPDNFFEGAGGPHNMWGQDRAAMDAGHWSGLANLLWEDFVVQESMGPVVDRSREHLGVGDLAITQMRRALLTAVREFQRTGSAFSQAEGSRFGDVEAPVITVSEGTDWHTALALRG